MASRAKLVPPAKSRYTEQIRITLPSKVLTGHTRELIKFKAEGDREEDKLVRDRDEEGDREVVVV